jgi:RNA polymerase sigma-70 factor (ECF subfamily)
MSPSPRQIPDFVVRAAAGDRAAVVELLERYRGRLRRMVAMRLAPRVKGRADASDVIQEGYIGAMRRLKEFIRDPSVPFSTWLRFLVGQRVQEQHRRRPAVTSAARSRSTWAPRPGRAPGPWLPGSWAS